MQHNQDETDRGAGRVVLADLEETKKDVTRFCVLTILVLGKLDQVVGGRDVLSIMQFGELEF